MLCSDCDEETEGVDGYGGGVGRQERGSEREKMREGEEKKNSECTKKRERKANEK